MRRRIPVIVLSCIVSLMMISCAFRKEMGAQQEKVNFVLSLDGDGDYAIIPDSPGMRGGPDVLKTIEIMFSAKDINIDTPTSEITASTLVAKALDDSSKDWGIKVLNDGTVQYWSETYGEDYALSGSKVAPDVWHHAAAVLDQLKSKVSLYVDGTLVASEEMNIGEHSASTSADVEIGTVSYSPTIGREQRFFRGQIDEVRIWNIARTQEEIQSTMGTTLTGHEEGLVGYWNFDDGSVKDLSPSGNDVVLWGDAHLMGIR